MNGYSPIRFIGDADGRLAGVKMPEIPWPLATIRVEPLNSASDRQFAVEHAGLYILCRRTRASARGRAISMSMMNDEPRAFPLTGRRRCQGMVRQGYLLEEDGKE